MDANSIWAVSPALVTLATGILSVVCLISLRRHIARLDEHRRSTPIRPAVTPAPVDESTLERSDHPDLEAEQRALTTRIGELRSFESTYRQALRAHVTALHSSAPDATTRARVAEFLALIDNPRGATVPREP